MNQGKYLKEILKPKYLHNQVKKVYNSMNGDKKGKLTLDFCAK